MKANAICQMVMIKKVAFSKLEMDWADVIIFLLLMFSLVPEA